MDRYAKQVLLPQIGSTGQSKLRNATCAIIGCGGLGCMTAEILARAGVGRLIIADRDIVEEVNLHRQILFDEEDAKHRVPKAEAARKRLSQVNSSTILESHVTDVNSRNVETLIAEATVVLDGTDNIETRYLINDACVKMNKPWIYGGAVSTNGLVMTVVPYEGPCLRCALTNPPPLGSLPTCETAGVLASTPVVVAGYQAIHAIKLMVGERDHAGTMTSIDLWRNAFTLIAIDRNESCPACAEGRFEFLSSRKTSWVTTPCGRNAVQITPPDKVFPNLVATRESLSRMGAVRYNETVLTLNVEDVEINLFPDARAIINGTGDKIRAKNLYIKYVMS